MKATITDLAKYLGKNVRTLYYKKKTNPKEWELLWSGWLQKLKELQNDTR